MERLVINSRKIVHETVDGEVIIINLETGAYYQLVAVGADLWRGIEQGVPRAQLPVVIARRYGIPVDDARAGLEGFLDELVREEIVAQEPTPDDAGIAVAFDDGSEAGPYAPPTLAKFTNMSDLLLLDPIHDVSEQGWPNRRPD
jgi:hypothetical protein